MQQENEAGLNFAKELRLLLEQCFANTGQQQNPAGTTTNGSIMSNLFRVQYNQDVNSSNQQGYLNVPQRLVNDDQHQRMLWLMMINNGPQQQQQPQQSGNTNNNGISPVQSFFLNDIQAATPFMLPSQSRHEAGHALPIPLPSTSHNTTVATPSNQASSVVHNYWFPDYMSSSTQTMESRSNVTTPVTSDSALARLLDESANYTNTILASPQGSMTSMDECERRNSAIWADDILPYPTPLQSARPSPSLLSSYLSPVSHGAYSDFQYQFVTPPTSPRPAAAPVAPAQNMFQQVDSIESQIDSLLEANNLNASNNHSEEVVDDDDDEFNDEYVGQVNMNHSKTSPKRKQLQRKRRSGSSPQQLNGATPHHTPVCLGQCRCPAAHHQQPAIGGEKAYILQRAARKLEWSLLSEEKEWYSVPFKFLWRIQFKKGRMRVPSDHNAIKIELCCASTGTIVDKKHISVKHKHTNLNENCVEYYVHFTTTTHEADSAFYVQVTVNDTKTNNPAEVVCKTCVKKIFARKIRTKKRKITVHDAFPDLGGSAAKQQRA